VGIFLSADERLREPRYYPLSIDGGFTEMSYPNGKSHKDDHNNNEIIYHGGIRRKMGEAA